MALWKLTRLQGTGRAGYRAERSGSRAEVKAAARKKRRREAKRLIRER